MKIRLFLFALSFIGYTVLAVEAPRVKIYSHNNNEYYEHVKKELARFDVKFDEVKSINKEDSNLYIIFDVFSVRKTDLPQYYIIYQTCDLQKEALKTDDLECLVGALAVWDYSNDNINYYRSKTHNWFYFPKEYQFVDPLILPCFLTSLELEAYANLIKYSNSNNTDISSHLPLIFYYALKQNPKLILEVGVRGGESTIPLSKVLNFSDATLIGIDIDPASKDVYNKIKNAVFVLINDVNFADYYSKSQFKDEKIDVVFIDTSHEYKHTCEEIAVFEPLLSETGIMMFHDSNVTPLNNYSTYIRLNGSYGHALGNPRGVAPAIKDFLSIAFDENAYVNTRCVKNGIEWQLIHYPFCNGLTILKKVKQDDHA